MYINLIPGVLSLSHFFIVMHRSELTTAERHIINHLCFKFLSLEFSVQGRLKGKKKDGWKCIQWPERAAIISAVFRAASAGYLRSKQVKAHIHNTWKKLHSSCTEHYYQGWLDYLLLLVNMLSFYHLWVWYGLELCACSEVKMWLHCWVLIEVWIKSLILLLQLFK